MARVHLRNCIIGNGKIRVTEDDFGAQSLAELEKPKEIKTNEMEVGYSKAT